MRVYDQTLGIDCPKRKNVRKKTRSRRALYFVSNVPKSAEGRFRSFETGDYSNESWGWQAQLVFARCRREATAANPDAA